jgi:hypothetical protein
MASVDYKDGLLTFENMGNIVCSSNIRGRERIF